jgi:hypothetical protein
MLRIGWRIAIFLSVSLAFQQDPLIRTVTRPALKTKHHLQSSLVSTATQRLQLKTTGFAAKQSKRIEWNMFLVDYA